MHCWGYLPVSKVGYLVFYIRFCGQFSRRWAIIFLRIFWEFFLSKWQTTPQLCKFASNEIQELSVLCCVFFFSVWKGTFGWDVEKNSVQFCFSLIFRCVKLSRKKTEIKGISSSRNRNSNHLKRRRKTIKWTFGNLLMYLFVLWYWNNQTIHAIMMNSTSR